MNIDSNVPMPSKFPFAQMQVGDSFLIPADVKRTAVNVAAMRYGKKHRVKFTVRGTTEGYRCWRIE
jgi:hypothetical protein